MGKQISQPIVVAINVLQLHIHIIIFDKEVNKSHNSHIISFFGEEPNNQICEIDLLSVKTITFIFMSCHSAPQILNAVYTAKSLSKFMCFAQRCSGQGAMN